MTTLANEHISQHPSLTSTRQHKAALWGYFFYCEVLKILRDPPTLINAVAFPTIIFLILGYSLLSSQPSTVMASFAAYGVFVVAFTTFSISLATERSLGWNKLLRTTSMSSALYLGSKLLVILLTGTISMLILFAVAGLTGKVQLGLAVWAQLLGTMVLGILPLSLLGAVPGVSWVDRPDRGALDDSADCDVLRLGNLHTAAVPARFLPNDRPVPADL